MQNTCECNIKKIIALPIDWKGDSAEVSYRLADNRLTSVRMTSGVMFVSYACLKFMLYLIGAGLYVSFIDVFIIFAMVLPCVHLSERILQRDGSVVRMYCDAAISESKIHCYTMINGSFYELELNVSDAQELECGFYFDCVWYQRTLFPAHRMRKHYPKVITGGVLGLPE